MFFGEKKLKNLKTKNPEPQTHNHHVLHLLHHLHNTNPETTQLISLFISHFLFSHLMESRKEEIRIRLLTLSLTRYLLSIPPYYWSFFFLLWIYFLILHRTSCLLPWRRRSTSPLCQTCAVVKSTPPPSCFVFLCTGGERTLAAPFFLSFSANPSPFGRNDATIVHPMTT